MDTTTTRPTIATMLIVAAMALCMGVASFFAPAALAATASAENTETFEEVAGYMHSIQVDGKPVNITCSNKKVLTVKRTSFKGSDSTIWNLQFKCKKAGKATVTYKMAGVLHAYKCRVYKYQNPTKLFKIGSAVFTNKFKNMKTSTSTTNLLSGTLKVKPAKGWKIDSIMVTGDFGKKTYKMVKSGYKLPSRKVCAVSVWYINKKTQMSEVTTVTSTSTSMTKAARSLSELMLM